MRTTYNNIMPPAKLFWRLRTHKTSVFIILLQYNPQGFRNSETLLAFKISRKTSHLKGYVDQNLTRTKS